MSWKTKYNIEFKGLKEGIHDFEFEIDDKFFAHFEERLFDSGQVSVKVFLEKRGTFLKLDMAFEGWLELPCGRCLENYRQPVHDKTELFVKFGQSPEIGEENVIWLLPEEHAINMAQTMYEYVTLSIPLRQIHPKNSEGKRECNEEMIKKLKQYRHPEKEKATDPRWDGLKGLINNN